MDGQVPNNPGEGSNPTPTQGTGTIDQDPRFRGLMSSNDQLRAQMRTLEEERDRLKLESTNHQARVVAEQQRADSLLQQQGLTVAQAQQEAEALKARATQLEAENARSRAILEAGIQLPPELQDLVPTGVTDPALLKAAVDAAIEKGKALQERVRLSLLQSTVNVPNPGRDTPPAKEWTPDEIRALNPAQFAERHAELIEWSKLKFPGKQ